MSVVFAPLAASRGDPNCRPACAAVPLEPAVGNGTAGSTFSAPLRLEGIAHSMLEAGCEKPVLARLNREFAAGRFHVVSGPSGAGKTTLLSVLSLTVRASQGMVLWGKDNLTRMSPGQQAEWRRAQLGMVFQTSRLVAVMTVAEHIALAATVRRKAEALDRGEDLLAALGMADKRASLPAQLSGGEKQRVAIAQALCAEPAVLLADEPTAALDRSNAERVADTLKAYARTRQAVVICVSHDHAVIDAADELLMLERPTRGQDHA